MVERDELKTFSEIFERACRERDVNPLFCVLSGSHCYGYDTPASDYDLRGVFVGNPDEIFGFGVSKEEIEVDDGAKLDMELFEIGKFAKLLAKPTLNMLDWTLNQRLCFYGRNDQEQFHELARRVLCKRLIPQVDGIVHNCKKEGKKRYKFLAFQFLRGAVLLESGSFFTNLPDIYHWAFLRHHEKALELSSLFARLISGDVGVTDALYMGAEQLWESAKYSTLLPEMPPREAWDAAEELTRRFRYKYFDELMREAERKL